MLHHESKGHSLLTDAGIERDARLYYLHVLHEGVHVLLQQREHEQVLHGHLVLWVVQEQTSADLVQFAFTEEQIVWHAIATQTSIEGVRIDLFLLS